MNMTSCPICKSALSIKKYHCSTCAIDFEGEFDSGWSSNLNSQQMEFVYLFLLVQGNIKEMEKRLKISYPTVKNRLGEIIRIIAPTAQEPKSFDDILNDLEEGFIDVDEALNMISERRK